MHSQPNQQLFELNRSQIQNETLIQSSETQNENWAIRTNWIGCSVSVCVCVCVYIVARCSTHKVKFRSYGICWQHPSCRRPIQLCDCQNTMQRRLLMHVDGLDSVVRPIGLTMMSCPVGPVTCDLLSSDWPNAWTTHIMSSVMRISNEWSKTGENVHARYRSLICLSLYTIVSVLGVIYSNMNSMGSKEMQHKYLMDMLLHA